MSGRPAAGSTAVSSVYRLFIIILIEFSRVFCRGKIWCSCRIKYTYIAKIRLLNGRKFSSANIYIFRSLVVTCNIYCRTRFCVAFVTDRARNGNCAAATGESVNLSWLPARFFTSAAVIYLFPFRKNLDRIMPCLFIIIRSVIDFFFFSFVNRANSSYIVQQTVKRPHVVVVSLRPCRLVLLHISPWNVPTT